MSWADARENLRPAPFEARPGGAQAPSSDARLGWPIAPVVVTSPFGYRPDPFRTQRPEFHSGIDLVAKRGRVVNAAGPGRVVRVGWMGGCGRTVVIEHAGGYQTIYGHLGRILTRAGAEVDEHTPVGLVGSSGHSTGPHLHFEVRRRGRLVDPRKIVESDEPVVIAYRRPAPARVRTLRVTERRMAPAQTLALQTPPAHAPER